MDKTINVDSVRHDAHRGLRASDIGCIGGTRVTDTASADALACSFTTSYAGVVAFLAVAGEGSFAKAADRLGVGRSAVSRNVQKLEMQLGARLFSRTTRRTSLTREGELFYQNCHPGVERIMHAIEEMRELREGPPRGQLRIRSSVGFGKAVVAPLLRDFRTRYPEIALQLVLDDGPVDFVSDRVDLLFRDGKMEDSEVVAKRLIPMRMVVCASAEYARVNGLPRTLDALAQHRCVNFCSTSGRIDPWAFKVAGQDRKQMLSSAHTYNDAELVLQAVLDGQGLAQMAAFQVDALLRDARLVACLEDHAPNDRGHYLCYLSRKQLPARIRVFIDYMTDQIRALDAQWSSSCHAPGDERS